MEIKKLYYSISEVSKMTGLKQYVLRYWETEFSQLSPKKNKAGNRKYKESDIQTINLIKKLLYDNKYTIEGARQHFLNKNKSDSLDSTALSNDILLEMKNELESIIDLIKKIK